MPAELRNTRFPAVSPSWPPLSGRRRRITQLCQYPRKALEGPFELLAVDDQGRRDADDVLVGLLAKQALLLQGLAEIALLAGLEPISKAPAANAWKDLLSLPFS